MTQITSAPQAAKQLLEHVVAEWSQQLKVLLETKHLYQSVDVEIPLFAERSGRAKAACFNPLAILLSTHGSYVRFKR